MLVQTKILDTAPGVIEKYALNDEQALLGGETLYTGES